MPRISKTKSGKFQVRCSGGKAMGPKTTKVKAKKQMGAIYASKGKRGAK